jgi:hypothetical protein
MEHLAFLREQYRVACAEQDEKCMADMCERIKSWETKVVCMCGGEDPEAEDAAEGEMEDGEAETEDSGESEPKYDPFKPMGMRG